MSHDPMLDGITRYGDPTHDYMLPAHGEGFVVLFSDLPALLAAVREDERQRVTSDFAEYLRHMEEWQAGYNKGHAAGVEQGQRDERGRHANELDVAVAKARAEVVTVDLEGDFNYVKGYNDGYVKGYNDGLVEGDAKGRREGKRIASMRGESDG